MTLKLVFLVFQCLRLTLRSLSPVSGSYRVSLSLRWFYRPSVPVSLFVWSADTVVPSSSTTTSSQRYVTVDGLGLIIPDSRPPRRQPPLTSGVAPLPLASPPLRRVSKSNLLFLCLPSHWFPIISSSSPNNKDRPVSSYTILGYFIVVYCFSPKITFRRHGRGVEGSG